VRPFFFFRGWGGARGGDFPQKGARVRGRDNFFFLYPGGPHCHFSKKNFPVLGAKIPKKRFDGGFVGGGPKRPRGIFLPQAHFLYCLEGGGGRGRGGGF